MKKKFILFFVGVLGLGFAHPALSACTWSQTGHVVAVDGTNMPTSFNFKMDDGSDAWTDNAGAHTDAYEWVRYDGTLSGNTAQANNRVVYAQVLAALMSGKSVYNCGPSAYTAEGGRDLVSEQIYVTSD